MVPRPARSVLQTTGAQEARGTNVPSTANRLQCRLLCRTVSAQMATTLDQGDSVRLASPDPSAKMEISQNALHSMIPHRTAQLLPTVHSWFLWVPQLAQLRLLPRLLLADGLTAQPVLARSVCTEPLTNHHFGVNASTVRTDRLWARKHMSVLGTLSTRTTVFGNVLAVSGTSLKTTLAPMRLV